jgi:hypothetical protein
MDLTVIFGPPDFSSTICPSLNSSMSE